MEFLTIRQTARQECIPENALRTLLKQNELPGFYSGTRFYVNVEELRKRLGALPSQKKKY